MGAFHALLIEGVPGIGKSTLIDLLIRRHVAWAEPRRIRSFLHLAQTHTYGPLAPAEDARTLTVAANLALLDRVAETLEWLCADLRHSDKPCFVLIDSLHLTHCLRPGVLAWNDVAPIDRRLAALGSRLALLTGRKETIGLRTIRDRQNSQFLSYAAKFGRTAEEIHGYFVCEQVEFMRLFEKSGLQKRIFENDGGLDTIVSELHEFWLRGRDAPGTAVPAVNA